MVSYVTPRCHLVTQAEQEGYRGHGASVCTAAE